MDPQEGQKRCHQEDRFPGLQPLTPPASSSISVWEELHEKCPGVGKTGPEGHLLSVPWEGEGSCEAEEHVVGQRCPPLATHPSPPTAPGLPDNSSGEFMLPPSGDSTKIVCALRAVITSMTLAGHSRVGRS